MTSNAIRMTGAFVAAIAAAGVSTLAAIAAEPAAVPAAPAPATAAPAVAPAVKVAPVEAVKPAAEAPAAEAVEAAPAADAAPAPEKAAAAPAGAPKAGDLALGAVVVGADGKEVGKINRVRTGASGAVSEIHVMTGGKQGMVAVPGDRIASGGASVKLSLTSDEVSKLPPLGGGNG